MPTPYQTVLTANGDPVSGALIWTYLAGTTTPQDTFTDVTISIPNSNPIVADSAGRFVAYLPPGTSYKFVYEMPATPPAHGSVIHTDDNVSSVPTTSANLDALGVAGEALAAGQVVYLSDGSGGKTAGQWYLADADFTYSSTTPVIGMTAAAIAMGQSGVIRLNGTVTGLSSLVVGATYYVSSTPGGLTSTPPTNRRQVGVADTTSSIILGIGASASPTTNPTICQGRMTLQIGMPVTETDVTAATAVKFTPYLGNKIGLYDGTNWNVRTFAELSIAVPATTSTNYDLFIYDNAGVPTLEVSAAWTSAVAIFGSGIYATNRPQQDGIYVKSTDGTAIDATRRYLGTFRTTTVSGQTEDSFTARYVWNYANRVRRILYRTDPTDSWTYTLQVWRQANASAANQVDCVIGVAEVAVTLVGTVSAVNSTADALVFTGIGEDSTTAPHAKNLGKVFRVGAAATTQGTGSSWLSTYPAIGRHFYAWLEYGNGVNATTWFGDNGAPDRWTAGLSGWIEG